MIQAMQTHWRRLTEPIDDIREPDRRRQVRLFSSAILVTVILWLATTIIGMPVLGYALKINIFQDSFFYVSLLLGVVLFGSYILSRTQYSELVRRIALTISIAFVLFFSVAAPDFVSYEVIIVYLTLQLMSASLFEPYANVMKLAGMILVALCFVPILFSQVTFTMWLTPMPFITIMFAVSLVAMEHRDALEHDRQAVLTQALEHVETLYQTSQELILADGPDAYLHAFAEPIMKAGPCNAALLRIDKDKVSQLYGAEVVASVKAIDGTVVAPTGTRFQLSDSVLAKMFSGGSWKMQLIKDVQTIPDLIDGQMDAWLQAGKIRSLAVIPLPLAQEDWIGIVTFAWEEPHDFSSQEEQIFAVLGPQLGMLYNSYHLSKINEDQAQFTGSLLANLPIGIVVLSPQGYISQANQAFRNMSGYLHEEPLMGKGFASLMAPYAIEELARIIELCTNQNKSSVHKIELVKADGNTFIAQMQIVAFEDSNEQSGSLLISVEDITHQAHAEDRIKASLQEKEVMLQEIHHRVKNNMQIMSSLLSLQASRIEDDAIGSLFHNSQDRIRSMALVHEQLYQSQDLARIDFDEYIRDLIDHLLRSYAVQGVSLQVEAVAISVDIDVAIPCGLIINELVSNALKHGFPDDRGGEITVGFEVTEAGRYTLVVRDNGVGFEESIDFLRESRSLGLQLVHSLTHQLNGTLSMHSRDSTVFEIEFPARDHDIVGRTQ